jgi:uncharacterized protein YndB with AHSA1/START domain
MKTKMEKAQVSMPTDSTVRVTRSFAAPRELVYRAHTEPSLMQRWLVGYPGWTMPVCEMDVRVGGKYRWRWRSIEDGKEFGFHGEFTEVRAPAKLAHTQYFDPGDVGGDMGEGALITVELTQKGPITEYVCNMDFHTKQARDAAVATGMTDGMEVNFGTLDAMLPQLQ